MLLSSSLFASLIFSCFFLYIARSEYLLEPSLEWTYQLPGSGSLSGRGVRKDNAVVVSYDGSSVFVTADDGTLHIVKPSDLSSSIVVDVPINSSNSSTECRSGISISETSSRQVNFVVYAVTMLSNKALKQNLHSTTDGDPLTESLVIAVHEDGSIRWTLRVLGYVEGTPLVGAFGSTIYISHNVPTVGGILTIVHDNQGSPVVAAELTIDGDSLTFGPLTITYNSTDETKKDVLFWGGTSSVDDDESKLYMLTQSDDFDKNKGLGNQSYIITQFGSWGKSLVVKPTVSSDLSGLWVGGGFSTVAGWIGDTSPFNVKIGSQESIEIPFWESALEQSEWDSSQPLFTALAITNDNTLLYATDATFNLVCIDVATGEIVWSNDGGRKGGYMAEPKLSEVNGQTSMVYVIETEDGNVRQHDGEDGDINWTTNCFDRSGIIKCRDSVEAEFSLSSNGNNLYFADIFGTVTALKVATFPAPAPIAPVATPEAFSTSAPTLSPTGLLLETPSPVSISPLSPSGNPPSVFSGSSFPTQEKLGDLDSSSASRAVDSDNKKQVVVFSLVGIVLFFALLAVVFFCLLIRKRLKSRKEDMEIEKEAEAQRKWRTQKKQLEEECKRKEREVIEEITTVQAELPATPEKAPKEIPLRLEERTPETLASIEELANEDISVSPSVVEDDDTESLADGHSGNIPKSETTSMALVPGNTSDTNGFKYLPVALAVSFDRMVGDMGIGGISASSVVKSVVGDVAQETENILDTDRPWAHLNMNGKTKPDDDSSIGSSSMFIEGDEDSLRSGSVNETSQPGRIKTKRQAEEPKEPENDAWTKIMSSLIDVEKQFFNPNFVMPSKTHPELKAKEEKQETSQHTSEALESMEVTLSSTLESNTAATDSTTTGDSDHIVSEETMPLETEDNTSSSQDVKLENKETPPALFPSPENEIQNKVKTEQTTSGKEADSANPAIHPSTSFQEKPFDEDNRLNSGSRSIIL